MNARRLGLCAAGLLGAAAMAVPYVAADQATLHMMSLILIWSIFALGYDLVFGLAGMLSFGHAAMFGAGSYALALLTTKLGVPFLWALLAAGVVGALVAFVFSLFALRVSGLFFSLLTLALAQLLYFLAGTKLRVLTGGVDGLSGVPRPDLFGIDFYNDRNYYLFVVVIFLIALGAAAVLRGSPFGQLLRGIRVNDVRAEQLGFNVQRSRQAIFVISGFYGGVSGALLASLLFYVSPQVLHWTTSGDVAIMTLLGGMGTLLGPVFGVALFEILREELSRLTNHWYGILGLIFILCTIFSPRGLAGMFNALRQRVSPGGRA